MRITHRRNTVARHLFALFVLCSVLPMAAAALFSARELNGLIDRRADERLADFASSYGMSIFGRLAAADDLLRSLTQVSGSAHRVVLTRTGSGSLLLAVSPGSANAPGPAVASPEQLAGLAGGKDALLLPPQKLVAAHPFLLTETPAHELVYGELDPASLWGDAAEAPAEIQFAVVDAALQTLAGSRPLTSSAIQALDSEQMLRKSSAHHLAWREDGNEMAGQVWEIFLASRFANPPVYIVAYARRPTLFGELQNFKLLFPAILLLVMACTLWLSMAQIRRQMRPLEALIDGTRRLTRRDFTSPVVVSSRNEFGELAGSFNSMARSLQQQFSALESMAEIDRLLLRSPDLEGVLDILLPRIVAILEVRTVSVLLIDADSDGHARMYDCCADPHIELPLRRVLIDLESLQCPGSGEASISVAASQQSRQFDFLRPLREVGAQSFRLWRLQQADALAGFLIVGQDAQADESRNPVLVAEFVDRLALVLANLEQQRQLYQQANFDSLTALPNRNLFQQRLTHALQHGEPGALLYIDLDHFKRVNDIAGHAAGDELLHVVAQRLRSNMDDGDLIARLGGDEFAVMLRAVQKPEIARRVCTRILSALAAPISISGREHYIDASIGVTLFPEDGRTIGELLKNGDIAMYRAKDAGRGQAIFFEPTMNERMVARASLENDLHRALQERQFVMHYQPIVRSSTRELSGAEALIRWPAGAGRPLRAPTEFIPAAEESGLIVELGDWVLESSLRQIASWHQQGIMIDYISVNVSPRQLREASLLGRIRDLLRGNHLRPDHLQVEITESVLGEGAEMAHGLSELSKLGVRIALDDFGTGYSSLGYLRTYPINTIKIDRSFVEGLPGDDAACTLVKTILLMCQGLGKSVVAEGVESEAQAAYLLRHGCDSLQGYLVSKALAPAEFDRFAAASARLSAAL